MSRGQANYSSNAFLDILSILEFVNRAEKDIPRFLIDKISQPRLEARRKIYLSPRLIFMPEYASRSAFLNSSLYSFRPSKILPLGCIEPNLMDSLGSRNWDTCSVIDNSLTLFALAAASISVISARSM